jgi:membrane protease YdiL (CAAX protease family)
VVTDPPRRSHRFLVAELVVAALVLAAGLAGFAPFGATPALVALGAASLWLRREGVRDVGLVRVPPVGRTVVLGLVAGVSYQALSLYIIEPALARLTGRLPDVRVFAALEGDVRFFLFSLALAWILAGFGEEFVYRGYLMNRLAQLLGGYRYRWVVALVITSVVFSLGHGYQGLSGVITTGLTGLFFGILYLACGRNLWVPILAHGALDTFGFLLIFFGRYPGQ